MIQFQGRWWVMVALSELTETFVKYEAIINISNDTFSPEEVKTPALRMKRYDNWAINIIDDWIQI